MSDLQTYRGNCHCGAFVYEIQCPEIKTVNQCNCSCCHRKGYLFVMPGKENFKIVKGSEDELSIYEFGSKMLAHKFCSTCGTAIMATANEGAPFPPEMQVLINAHSIQGLNTWELEKKPFDGKNFGEPYKPATHKGDLPSAEIEGGKLYHGSCHCGAVTIALKSKPLDETYPEQIVQCNCSTCERNAYVWCYPENEQVVLAGADADIVRYSFNSKILAKTFCKTCGVQMTNSYNNLLTQEEEAALDDRKKKWRESAKMKHPVNMRTLEGVDLNKCKITSNEGWQLIPPPYVNP